MRNQVAFVLHVPRQPHVQKCNGRQKLEHLHRRENGGCKFTVNPAETLTRCLQATRSTLHKDNSMSMAKPVVSKKMKQNKRCLPCRGNGHKNFKMSNGPIFVNEITEMQDGGRLQEGQDYSVVTNTRSTETATPDALYLLPDSILQQRSSSTWPLSTSGL